MKAHALRTTLTPKEAAVLTAICFGLPIFWSLQAISMDFPDARVSSASTAALIVVELVLATAALLYLKARQFDIHALYPHPSVRGTFIGIGLFFGAWILAALFTLPFQSDDKRQVIEFSFTGMSVASIVVFSMINSAFEEIFLLGGLVNGLRGFGLSIAVGVPLLIRVSYHLYQGPLGAVSVLAFGVVMSVGYLATRQLWPSVFAHTLGDIVPMLFG